MTYTCFASFGAGFFVCKLKKLDNNKRTDLQKEHEEEEEEEEQEEQQQQQQQQQQPDKVPKLKVRSTAMSLCCHLVSFFYVNTASALFFSLCIFMQHALVCASGCPACSFFVVADSVALGPHLQIPVSKPKLHPKAKLLPKAMTKDERREMLNKLKRAEWLAQKGGDLSKHAPLLVVYRLRFGLSLQHYSCSE